MSTPADRGRLDQYRATHARKTLHGFDYAVGGSGASAVVMLHGGGSTFEAIAAHRREIFASGRVSKQSLLSDADVLVDFFSTPFAPGPVETMVIEAEHDRMVDEHEREALKVRYPAARVLTLRGDDHFGAAVPSRALLATIAGFLAGPHVSSSGG